MGRQNFTVINNVAQESNLTIKPSWTSKEKDEYREKILSFLRENYKILQVPIFKEVCPSTSFGYIEKYKDEEMSKLIHFLFLTDDIVLNAVEKVEQLKKEVMSKVKSGYLNLKTAELHEAF